MFRNTDFLTKKQGFIGEAQQGSVIIWILIAVALFAALNYAVSMGSRGGAATISKEQAAIAATEILDYGRVIKQAVQTLQINGCSDTQISFENPIVSGYTNPNAPADKSCHVFDVAGGGLNYQAPKEAWADGVNTAQTHYRTWFAEGVAHVDGLGIDAPGSSSCLSGEDDCMELMIGVPFVKEKICLAINKKLNWGYDGNGTPYQDNGNSFAANGANTFQGNYSVNGHNMGNASPSGYSGVMVGCIEGSASPASGTYSFFQVLIVR